MNVRNFLFAVVIIPVSEQASFLDLKYSKLRPNKVEVKKEVVIFVDESASPLFYKMPKVSAVKSIEVEGAVEIVKGIDPKLDDSYFQLGIIYEGEYRPSAFVKTFLPEWLLKVLSLSSKKGVGKLSFHEASAEGKTLNKKDSIRKIELEFSSATTIKDNKFTFKVSPEKKNILGFWLRADGDDSKAKFKTTLKSLKIFH